MKSLPGYFEHINGKTYLNRYPESIIKIDSLRDKIFVEFGGGWGNDIVWLLDQGFSPKNMFFIEFDKNAYEKSLEQLKERFGIYGRHLLLKNAARTGLKNEFTDFVYANNTLHCLETKNRIVAILQEGFRILKDRGVFFGRTLMDKIDKEKLKAVSNPKNEEQEFALRTAHALQEDILLGMTEVELKKIAQKVGFRNVYSESKPAKWKPTNDFYFKFEK